MKKKIQTKQLVLDAMLAAMCTVLGYLSLDFGSFKITFESFPILVVALLFGPGDGMLVAAVGEFLYQMLRYGLDSTTALWIIPYVIVALLAGFYAERRAHHLTRKQYAGIIFLTEYVVTVLNTGVLVIHSKLFGYYTPEFITGALALRCLITAAKATAFTFALPPLLQQLQRVKGE